MSLSFLLKDVLRTTSAHLKKLEKMGLKNVQDLLEYFPRTVESTEIRSDFQHIQLDQKNTITGKLCDFRVERTPRAKKIGKGALVLDDGSVIEAIWFHIPYILRNIKDETRVYLIGKISRNYGKIQISNPEVHLDSRVHVGGIRAIYSESPPINSKWLREKMAGLLVFNKEFSDPLPDQIKSAEKFLSKAEAITKIHHPQSIQEWKEARHRLAFEEIFEIQVRVLRQKYLREKSAENLYHVPFDVDAVKADLATLPFELTTAQKKVLFQILTDFEKSQPAHRLVQGDVGSGKTIVAFLAAAAIARAGYQVAILAPTEILAQQHFEKSADFFDPKGIKVELLTGSTPAKQKRVIKQHLATGQIDILIGTHAILTEDTVFKHLGLAIIDEQHRFGVAQRAILAENNAHQVAMTATPIPRTLALTIYGDQDLSVIDELPAGRKPIITRVIADTKMEDKMNLFIDDQIVKNRQIFWVCPLVDESDKIEAKSVINEYERIRQVFKDRRVDFLHGKMKPKDKEAIMTRFKNHEFDILVSTSVIEVGVDIPAATAMVIENSERFGLSQLHQFRGRIGRNDMQSYCFLMCGKAEHKNKTRLRSMEKHHSGQKLAEIDLELRGMGDVYGTKQSGMPDFKVADLTNLPLLESAKDWAEKILAEDVTLEKYPALKKRIESQDVYF